MDDALPSVFIGAGEIYFSAKPSRVLTVLGSCVSVTMFSQRTGIGAICHNMLPVCRDHLSCSGICDDIFRYVQCTVKEMVQGFIRKGICTHEIDVKLFGGSDMFVTGEGKSRAITVGRQNIETATKVLGDLGLNIEASDTGGSQVRKIIFCTSTGDVLLKRLNRTEMRQYGKR